MLKILRNFPTVGRIVPKIDEQEIRENFYLKYRIVYHSIDQLTIHVVTVQHGARGVKNWF